MEGRICLRCHRESSDVFNHTGSVAPIWNLITQALYYSEQQFLAEIANFVMICGYIGKKMLSENTVLNM
jgi:hypothetical protein